MTRKLATLLAAVAVLALAAPALASAAPALTSPPGTLVPKSTKLTLVAEDFSAITFWGSFTCIHIQVPVVVTENSGSGVTLSATGAPPLECNFGGREQGWKGVLMTDLTMPSVSIKASGSSTAAVTFEADFPPVLRTCHYESSALPFTYVPGGTALKITGATKLTGKTHAPDCTEGAKIEADFVLKTAGGATVTID